jgi:S-formylglutathione hydrolase
MMTLDRQSQSACHGGSMEVWSHRSASTHTAMSFGIFLPDRVGRCPTLTCLGGLTSNHENFAQKAGAQRFAAEHGLILVFPDTSPRGANIPGEDDAIDVGTGAGFYCTATRPPWNAHYDMASYVARELPDLVEAHFPADPDRRGITGFSMGGHGALVTALRNPGRYRSVSAFSPIANPTVSLWGRRAFEAYLGPDEAAWQDWDASRLMGRTPFPGRILIDQGAADPYLDQLRPHTLADAAERSGQLLTQRNHAGYDHSYWFVQTFIADHIAHHAQALGD